jgi:8-amino-7-oxononanoate synthase
MKFDKAKLRKWKEAGLYRTRKILETPQSSKVICDGTPCVSFCSNNYLGLANHPDLIAAVKKGVDHYGVGSGASQLISGYSHAHAALEEEIAEFLGRSRALFFFHWLYGKLERCNCFYR